MTEKTSKKMANFEEELEEKRRMLRLGGRTLGHICTRDLVAFRLQN
jgi:hypothetical protein